MRGDGDVRRRDRSVDCPGPVPYGFGVLRFQIARVESRGSSAAARELETFADGKIGFRRADVSVSERALQQRERRVAHVTSQVILRQRVARLPEIRVALHGIL